VDILLLLFCSWLFSGFKDYTLCVRISVATSGLDAAHKKGRKGGRPKTLTDKKRETLFALKKAGEFSVTQMCAMVGITRSVYYRAINELE